MAKIVNIMMFFFMSGLVAQTAVAQLKYEKESRIQENEVPMIARDFIKSLSPEIKVKWYLEEGFDRTTLEAKFKYKKQQFSVEFDTLGHLEDVEIRIKLVVLPSIITDSINVTLDKDCEKFKIQKIQLQYSGEASDILAQIKNEENSGNYKIRYEIVARCFYHNQVHEFEYLFDDVGHKISMARIEQKDSSHLEY